jgi:ubiquinone/menaquinone biosynthesis C-methylase UbiE
MTTPQTNKQDYALGSSTHEQERLKLQASIVGGWTERFFRAAGLDRGMHVLDLGCGMGDVSLLAAEMVGPSGSVTGIDRDPVVIEKAQERCKAQGHAAPIDLVHCDLMEFRSEHRQFDAVVGRYVLLYQPDPSLAVKYAAEQVRSGGLICFHEMDFGNPIQSRPADSLFSRSFFIIGETFRRLGFPADFGLKLTETFLAAGLPWPQVKAEVPIGGEAGSYMYGWIAETLKSLLPRIEQFGLASAEELDLDTLAARIEKEAVETHSQLIGPLQFGAWAKKPYPSH